MKENEGNENRNSARDASNTLSSTLNTPAQLNDSQEDEVEEDEHQYAR